MVAWHLPTRSAISPGFAPFAYISSIIRRSSSFKHSYFIASPPFLRKKISASELISSFALNDKRHNALKVGKINVDEQMELAMRFQVSSIPMLVVFKDGKAVAKSVGYRPKSEIAAMVEGAK